MFLHCFRYNLLRLVRNKVMVFWMLLFPMLLGTFFYVAFSSLFSLELFEAVPVAIVTEQDNENFTEVLNTLSEGDDAILSVTYTDSEDEALALLKDETVKSIIYVGDELHFSTTAGRTIEKSIIKSILDQYNNNVSIITDIATDNPMNIEAVIASMQEEISPIIENNFSDGNMDEYVQYFYNLLAMACLFSAMAGMYSAIENQANLSVIGARRCTSPINRMTEVIASLFSTTILQYASMTVTSLYLCFVLQINFGTSFPWIMLINLIGVLFGVALGFFVGSIGRGSEGIKNAICLVITMVGSFLSGLMVAEMRMIIETNVPIINRINPVALISDTYYALNVYSTYDRVLRNLLTLLIYTALLYFGGFLLTRRKKYASL